jgi:hypothetical protein
MRRLTFVWFLPLLACGDQSKSIDNRIELEHAIALDNRLVLIDQPGHRALLIDVAEDPIDASAEIVDLPYDPQLAFRRRGKNEVLIVSFGRRASSKKDAEPAVLSALDGSGKLREYELGDTPFDKLEQSRDGRFAFLYKGTQSNRLLSNQNAIAVVDLDADPDDDGAVHLRTLVSFGDSPLDVVFSPVMPVLGEDRRLAVVLSQSNVTLLDLEHLDRQETTVQLSSGAGQMVQPVQVTFNADASELYVRGAGSNDVFVFTLATRPPSEDEPGERPHNDFRPFIDQLGVGGVPSDMDLYGEGDGTRLLVLSASASQAAVVETGTSQVTTVDLPTPMSQLYLFDAPSPRDDTSAERALLYQTGGNQLMFLDLNDLEERGSRNLEQLFLDNSIQKLIPMPEEQRVLVIHDTSGASLVDLASRTVLPITASTILQDAEFDAELKRFWVAPVGQPFLAWLDLETGEPRELLLDAPIMQFVPMFSAGKVAVLHDSDVGHVTIVDAENPTRENASSARGFLLSSILDRGE